LVRSGSSSAFDVNFGKEAGASAVMLLLEEITGVTVFGMNGGEIRYLPTKRAIEQRHVDTDALAFYEALGVCFGRGAETYAPTFYEKRGTIERYL
jgi:6-phosphofructokinase 1